MAAYGRILLNAGCTLKYRSTLPSRNSLLFLQQCNYTKNTEKVLLKLGIPLKPKRPLTPYIRFVTEERKKLMEGEGHKLANKDVLRVLAEKWKVHDPKEKEALQKAYDSELLTYSKQIMTYEQSITEEHRVMIKDELEKSKSDECKRELKKKSLELGKPKRPPTGFLQFLQENRYNKDKSSSTRQNWVKDRAAEWQAMSDDDKLRYKEESKKLMVQYKEDMKDWEANMVRKGHIDVVRTRGLIDIKGSAA